MLHYQGYPVSVLIEFVKAGLILYPGAYYQRKRDPHSQTEDVDEGQHLMLQKVPPGDFEVVSYHDKVQ
jgi:hypothetical protein